MKYYRVKFGFNNDDFISVNEEELEKAIIAQTTGKVGIFKEGTITGDKIISITPDVNRLMGWNRTYQPTAEDYGEISSSQLNEHHLLYENTRLKLTGGKPKEENKNLPSSEFSKSISDKFKI